METTVPQSNSQSSFLHKVIFSILSETFIEGTAKSVLNCNLFPVLVTNCYEKIKVYTDFENVVPGDVLAYNGHTMIVQSLSNGNGCYGLSVERTLSKIDGKNWNIWRQK